MIPPAISPGMYPETLAANLQEHVQGFFREILRNVLEGTVQIPTEIAPVYFRKASSE